MSSSFMASDFFDDYDPAPAPTLPIRDNTKSDLCILPQHVRLEIYWAICPHEIVLISRPKRSARTGKPETVTYETQPHDAFHTLSNLLGTCFLISEELQKAYLPRLRLRWESYEHWSCHARMPRWAHCKITSIRFWEMAAAREELSIIKNFPAPRFPFLRKIILGELGSKVGPAYDFGDQITPEILRALDTGATELKLPDDFIPYSLHSIESLALLHTPFLQAPLPLSVMKGAQDARTQIITQVAARGVALEYPCWLRHNPEATYFDRAFNTLCMPGKQSDSYAEGILQYRYDGVWLIGLQDLRGTIPKPVQT